MHILFVQYGDYAEAYNRIHSHSGQETYYAQKYSIDYLTTLTQKSHSVTVVSLNSPAPHDTVLPNKVRSIGLQLYSQTSPQQLVSLINSLDPKPTHLILRTPLTPVLKWALNHNVHTLPLFADYFPGSFTAKLKNFFLSRYLNNPAIRFIANHQILASQSLTNLGLPKNKIVPWDWPPAVTPNDFPPKSSPPSKTHFTLTFVGMLSESKGLADLLYATQLLTQQNLSPTLNIIGSGNQDHFEELANELHITPNCHFKGKLPHPEVLKTIAASDFLIVPSRHDYPEGLPMTLYEGLCTRTPIIASDHPMFQNAIQHEKSAIIFQSENPHDLRDKILSLLDNPDLYLALSQNSSQAWQAIQLDLKWIPLLNQFLFHTNDSAFLEQYSLQSN